MATVIRPAAPADASLILAFIRGLAEYERLSHEVKITQAGVAAMLFSPAPRAFCDIAETGDGAVGFALWYYTVNTFEGNHGLFLEDLYVEPSARGAGVGKALMARLARRCIEEGLGRLEWTVLDWNAPAIGFYDSLGATVADGWMIRRLRGDSLARLAAS